MRSNLTRAAGILVVGLLIAGCGGATPTASSSGAIAPSPAAPSAEVPSPAAPTPSATVAAGPVLPDPSGDLAVGVRDLEPTADGFGVRAWYPAEPATGTAGAAYATEQVWADFGSRFVKHDAAALARLVTTAATDATPAPTDGPRAVVLLMPGWYLPANSLTVLASDLASNGYVVMTIDPPAQSELPDMDEAARLERGEARLAAVRSVLATLGDPVLAGLVGPLDPDRVAVGGHSYGGTVSFAAGTGDPAVAAVFDLDGALGVLPDGKAVVVPALLVGAEVGSEWDATSKQILGDSKKAVAVGLGRAAHCDLVDIPLLLEATETTPEETQIGAWCFGPIGRDGPPAVAGIVRRFLDSALATPSVVPAAASLIEGVPDGYLDPLKLGG